MAQISIIVPVYRVEAYLRRCVDSILNQTFRDFQLILVDDGSPDSCGDMCDAFAAADERIHVIHRENGGLSAARNTGIDWALANSDSPWLTFVDSDDWLHPEALERLLALTAQYGVRVAVGGYGLTAGEPLPMEEDPRDSLVTPEEFYVSSNTNATVAWGKLYHRDCFRELRYPVGKLHEDEFTTYKILFSQEAIAVTSMPLYCYFQNEQGIMRSKWNPRRLDMLEALGEQISWFEARGFAAAREHAVMAYTYNLCRHLEFCTQSDLPEPEKRRYGKALKRLRRGAMLKYWRVFCHWRNLSIFVALFPALEVLVKLRHARS